MIGEERSLVIGLHNDRASENQHLIRAKAWVRHQSEPAQDVCILRGLPGTARAANVPDADLNLVLFRSYLIKEEDLVPVLDGNLFVIILKKMQK